MKEKKLTDKEIIKAWDICNSTPCCTSECPYFNKNGRNFCMEDKALYKDLKDLINRQKAEIERLTEEKQSLIGRKAGLYYSYNQVKEKNAELQKQVDELKEELEKKYETERANIRAEIADAGTSCHWCERQTIKDTAKEILTDIVEGFVFSYVAKSKDWQDGYDQAMTDYDNKLKEYFKKRGVEVE